MDLNTYLGITAFITLCAVFLVLGRRVAALDPKEDRPGTQLVFRLLLPAFCIVYLLMQGQYSSINLFQAIPAIITAVVVARWVPQFVELRPDSKWPAMGFIVIPLVFHITPRLGIALY